MHDLLCSSDPIILSTDASYFNSVLHVELNVFSVCWFQLLKCECVFVSVCV